MTTELRSHLREEVREDAARRVAGIEVLEPEDVADEVVHTVTRRRRVALNEVLLRPTEQQS